MSVTTTHESPVSLARVGFTSKGLRLNEGLPFEEWQRIGRQIATFGNAMQWAWGDWWFYGEWEYGSKYETALEITSLSYQTLADLKYVAGRFDFSRRRENLSLSHHREVAPLSVEEQDRWLDLAEQNGWSREQFRQALSGQLVLDAGDVPELPPSRVKPSGSAPSNEGPKAEVQLQLFVPDGLLEWTEWSEPVQIRVREGRLELRAVITQ